MIQAICWVLVHSLWQGVLLALAGGGVMLCTKRSAAAVRYRLLCGLVGVFLGGMGGTFLYEWALAGGNGDGTGGVGVSMNWLGDWCSAHAFQVVTVWLAVAVIKSVRMAAGWNYIRRMRREGLAAPALWVERVDGLSRQLGVRQAVKLVESVLVRVPMVIGQLRPIIYIPLGLINHLPASEMEAVLLHELAHIRRYDHLVNMVQQAAECLLFFNPGFLWISALIREERENSCDDIAIAHTRNRVEFVRALVRFKEHSIQGMTLAFPGNKRQLLHRVLRISRQENKTLSGKERFVLLGGCLVMLCLLMARADVKKKAEPVAGSRLAAVQLAEAVPVREVPKEVVAVLQERERVTQNMEWVKAKLDQLHHKPNIKKRAIDMDQEAMNVERAEQMGKEQQLTVEAAERDQQRAAELDRQQEAERVEQEAKQSLADKLQADRDREQDKLQADKDREQAELDRQQAERDRQQADRDRLQADRDRKQAELDRLEADKERERATMERMQVEDSRKQVERERQRGERDQQKSKNN
jgi:bla regulator protein BlaR1